MCHHQRLCFIRYFESFMRIQPVICSIAWLHLVKKTWGPLLKFFMWDINCVVLICWCARMNGIPGPSTQTTVNKIKRTYLMYIYIYRYMNNTMQWSKFSTGKAVVIKLQQTAPSTSQAWSPAAHLTKGCYPSLMTVNLPALLWNFQ